MPIDQLKKRVSRVYGTLVPAETREQITKIRRRISWRAVLKAGLLVLVGLFIVGTAFVAYISKDLPDPNKLQDRAVAQSTKIYDRTGTHLLYEAYQDEKRTLVPIDKINTFAVKATIAIEDKNFYEHHGVRPLSIMRAAFNNLIGRRVGSGGASTLTQQFIKKTIVGEERRGLAGIMRKVKEAILAIRLERKYSKDQILQLYLNEIPYGGTNYGIEAASQSYFHKSAADISLAECATLAALIQSPSYYLNHADYLRGRRDLVLKLMAEQGYITKAEQTQASGEALRIYRGNNLKDAPHFVLYVEQLLEDQFGKSAVDTQGLTVVTSLDYDKQKKAEQIVKENGDKFAKEADANNAALVAIDPYNAQVIAYVGSRDYNNADIDGMFDVAGFGKRQPGSSFKPFVYTYAFTKGYTPSTVIYDDSVNFELRPGAKPYAPKNYDQKEHGLVTFRKALQGSLNIPAVKVLHLVGPKNVIDFARGFGYSTFGDDSLYGLSLVLGGAEVNLLEHTNAYATLANNGEYHKPVPILKVTNSKGDVLYEWKESEGAKVVEPEVAATISNVLSDNNARAYIFGAVNNLTLPDRPVAAKTGTTNDTKDVWTMGYVPSLSVGVWVGNTKPSTMKGTSNKLAAIIWNQFMRFSLASTTPQQFPTPPANASDKPILNGSDAGISVQVNRLNGKIATSSTAPGLIEKRTYLPPHDILYYVNTDDPTGPPPADPSVNEQFQNWENALQEYVARQQEAGVAITLSDPPTEYDQGGDPTLAPVVSFVSPQNGATLNSKDVYAEVQATAPRGVSLVSLSLDGTPIAESNSFPFNFHFNLTNVLKGTHTLTATAVDDQGNSGVASVSLAVPFDSDPPSVMWTDRSPVQIAFSDFPHDLHLKPYRWDATKDLKIYLTAGGTKKLIWTFKPGEDTPVDGKLTLTLQRAIPKGHVVFEAVTTAVDGTAQTAQLDADIN